MTLDPSTLTQAELDVLPEVDTVPKAREWLARAELYGMPKDCSCTMCRLASKVLNAAGEMPAKRSGRQSP